MIRSLSAVKIDFQRRSAGAPRVLGRALAVLGAAMMLGVLWEYVSLGEEMKEQQSKIEQAQHTGGRMPGGSSASVGDGQRMDDSLRAASRVLDQLAMPWGALFTQIESAADEHVALLALQSDPANHSLRLSGEARDFGALMAYVRRLEESVSLAGVHLAGHEEKVQDPQHPVVFTVDARWVQR